MKQGMRKQRFWTKLAAFILAAAMVLGALPMGALAEAGPEPAETVQIEETAAPEAEPSAAPEQSPEAEPAEEGEAGGPAQTPPAEEPAEATRTEVPAASPSPSAAAAPQTARKAAARTGSGQGSVRVIVRNDTLKSGAWTGTILDTTVPVTDDLTMMTAVLRALAADGFSWAGYGASPGNDMSITYIESIARDGKLLGPSDDAPYGGWMCSLNDWFTSEGADQYTIANGRLAAGDVIRMEYSCNMGADIGSVWGDSDTSLASLKIAGAGLSPAFSGAETAYTLVLEPGETAVTITYRATNRNFQARAYKNSYVPTAESWIKSGQTVSLSSGDVLYVGVGNSAWPSMNTGVSETRYALAVKSSAESLNERILALPAPEVATLKDKDEIQACQALYESLSAQEQAQIAQYDKVEALLERMEELERIEAVRAQIEALPAAENLTAADEAQVTAAKQAFDALGTLQEEISGALQEKLEEAVQRMAGLMVPEFTEIYQATGAYLYCTVTNPVISQAGGEWAVIGLARSGYPVSEEYFARYIANVCQEVAEKEGVLDSRKYTEYSRVVLGLTAVGYDVTDVAGYNLLEPLADYDQVIWQGINGPVYALLALDSRGYEIPAAPEGKTQTTREKLIEYILEKEIASGGWALFGSSADPDITAIAIQALAAYYGTDSRVTAAVDRAVARLSAMQKEDGGFGSWGSVNSESCAQVVVALTALGIDPAADARFIKNGNSVMDALLSFAVEGGGFRHMAGGGVNGMATEQGYCALAAYDRLRSGKTFLYDMTDVIPLNAYESVEQLIAGIGEVGVGSGSGIAAARAAFDALPAAQRAKVKNADVLAAAEARLAELLQEISETIQKIGAIGRVTLESGAAIRAARAAYDALTAEQQALVENYGTLTAAEAAFAALNEKNETPEPGDAETDETKTNVSADGETKTLGDGETEITIGGVTYRVSEETAAAMRRIDGLRADGSDALEDVLAAYRLYAALSDADKAQVVNYSRLDGILEEIGAENHKDEKTGLSAEGLPWYIQMTVRRAAAGEDAYDALLESMGSNTLLMALEVTFTDIQTGEPAELPGTATLRLPAPDAEGYAGLWIARMLADGRMESMECREENGDLVFAVSEAAVYGVVGGAAEAEAVLEENGAVPADGAAQATGAPAPAASLLWLWILLGCLGVGALVLVILAKNGKLKKRD